MGYWDDVYQKKCASDFQAGDGWLLPFRACLPSGSRVLDLGCGSGANIPDLLSLGLRVTAADLSADAVLAVKARFPQAETACFDMTRPFPFESGSFDAVAADLSLHYFPWETTQRVVREIRRVLRPGGMLLARVHAVDQINPDGLEAIEPDYYVVDGCPRRYFRQEQLLALFQHGWQPELEKRRIERFGMIKQVYVLSAAKIP